VIQHYNTLYETPSLPKGYIEALLTDVESRAATRIADLVADREVSSEGFLDLAAFIYIQQQRTPRGREWLRFGLEQGSKTWLLKRIYEDREVTVAALTTDLGRLPTDEEVANYITRLAGPLEREEWKVQASRDQEVLSMLLVADTLVPLIYDMHWLLIEAPAGETFILSDDPVVRYDPENPQGAAGWRSSPTVNITLPVDPRLCLMLTQQPRTTVHHVAATTRQVVDLNLRTYAGAREAIFGPTQKVLQDVRTAAKANSALIAQYTPKAPNVHMIDSRVASGEPPTITTTQAPMTFQIRRGGRPKA
jgi:hypothetical protein